MTATQYSVPSALKVACAGFLFFAIGDWPYGFYTFLRIMTFITFSWVAYECWKNNRKNSSIANGILAITFNPFIPIELKKEAWVLIDLISAAYLIGPLLYKRYKSKKNTEVNEANNKPRLEGIGGWLLWLVIVLTCLIPLAVLGTTANELSETERIIPDLAGNPIWEKVKFAIWNFTIAQAIVFVAAGLLLWKTRLQSTVPIVISGIWIGGPLLSVVALFAVAHITQQDVSAVIDPKSAGQLLSSAAGATFWTFYLRLSKRVKNTYVEG